jgi:hypothetical protein
MLLDFTGVGACTLRLRNVCGECGKNVFGG